MYYDTSVHALELFNHPSFPSAVRTTSLYLYQQIVSIVNALGNILLTRDTIHNSLLKHTRQRYVESSKTLTHESML